MSLTAMQRRVLLGLALAGTVAAAIWPVDEEPAATAEPAQRGERPVMLAMQTPPEEKRRATDVSAPMAEDPDLSARPAGPLALEKLQRRGTVAEVQDLFGQKSWVPPPPPPPPPAPPPPPPPPPPPAAPPLPFTYLGMLEESPERTVYFLVRGERVIPVIPGDVVDGTYRIEKPEGSQMGITYLPLDIRQTLTIGNRS